MKLFYSPGACSLAPHNVAREASVAIDLVRVDLANQTTETQEDFKKINPRGYVPVLEIDGELHTEVVALVQHLAEQSPRSTLLPAAGTAARFRVNQWLGFVASELHKTLSPWLFREDAAESTRQAVRAKLAKRLAGLDAQLKDQAYLTGEHFTVADAYAYTVLSWSKFAKIDLDPYPNVRQFMARVAARPRVREALQAEGLLSTNA
jgi:glutathione S-transferase